MDGYLKEKLSILYQIKLKDQFQFINLYLKLNKVDTTYLLTHYLYQDFLKDKSFFMLLITSQPYQFINLLLKMNKVKIYIIILLILMN
jgi:hypothetical protein